MSTQTPGAAPPAAPGPDPGGVTQAAVTSLGRTWTLAMPAGLRLVNANQSWPHPAVRGNALKELRKAAWAIAHNALRAGEIPRLERVSIVVEYQPPRLTRKRDGGNWAPSGKAYIDGIKNAGVIPDDDSEHVILESYRIGDPFPKGRIVLYITDESGGEA